MDRDGKNREVIATGIRGLDKIIGGIRETELGIIAATTNRGKSIMGVHLGFHAIKKNHGVIHFSTEMHKDQVSMRYDSRWSRMVHAKFKTYDFTSAEIKSMAARLKKARMRYDGLLKIVSMPVSSARLAQMKTMVDELRATMPNLGLIILDSADHIRGEGKYQEKRHESADVYWEVAGWATEEKLAIWATAQLGKQAADRVGQSEDIADAYDKARIADIVATLNKPKVKSRATPKIVVGDDVDDDDDENDVKTASTINGDLELQLAKYRDGVANVRVPLQTDLKRMLIRDRDEDVEPGMREAS